MATRVGYRRLIGTATPAEKEDTYYRHHAAAATALSDNPASYEPGGLPDLETIEIRYHDDRRGAKIGIRSHR